MRLLATMALILLSFAQPVAAQTTEPAGETPAAQPSDPAEADEGAADEASSDEETQPSEPEATPEAAPDEASPAEPLPVDEQPSLLDQLRAEALTAAQGPVPPLQRYPYVEWHGYYRVRADLFCEADLGTYFATSEGEATATSLFLPPLTRNFVNSSGGASFNEYIHDNSENTLGTATMRLRLAPLFHLSPSIRIGTRIDILDNLVLGSTPEYMASDVYPGVPLDTLTGTQVPPSSGINSFNDSLSVKEAWVEWEMGASDDGTGLPLGTLKLGRFAWGWGLGIYSSAGDFDRGNGTLTPLERFAALEADGANYLDRIQWELPLGPIRLHAAYAFIASGPSSALLGEKTYAYDLDDLDDIDQFELAVTTLPGTAQEWSLRRKELTSGRPVFDWGLFLSYRSQEMAAQSASATDDDSANFSDLELVGRNAWVLVPDLFARMDWRPDPATRVYIGLEATALFGSVDHPTGLANEDSIDLLQWGGALESNITLGMVSFGLDLGAASGDSSEMVAVAQGRTTPWSDDNSWNTFSFNRNYRVDMLLYREVLGGVSNTVYVRPHFDFDLIPTEQSSFGGLISGIYGLALQPDAYAGNDPSLGTELDAMLFFEEAGHFMATAAFGVLLPLWGLDRPADYLISGVPAKDSVWAWTLQGNLYFVF